MGGRGDALQKGGFTSQNYHSVGTINGVKILEKINRRPREKNNLPIMSNTPSTAYILLDEDGKFLQYRKYGSDRRALYDIDYGRHNSTEDWLHIHFFKGGREANTRELTPKEIKRIKPFLINLDHINYTNVSPTKTHKRRKK